MASPKSKLTLYVDEQTERYVAETLDGGTPIDALRDYWYNLKDLAEMATFLKEDNQQRAKEGKPPHTAKSWEKKNTTLINSRVELMSEDDVEIYRKLGLKSRSEFVEGKAPIVVFFEKEKKVAIPIMEEFDAGYFWLEGMITTRDLSFIALHFDDLMYKEAYVFVVADYDPAGENNYKTVKLKMNHFATKTKINVINVEYGNDPINEFYSYDLRYNSTNKKWIDEGKTKGVEFNPPKNIELGILNYLRVSMEEHIDKRIYCYMAYRSWRWKLLTRNMMRDTHLQELIKKRRLATGVLDYKIEWIEQRHRQRVANIVPYFEHNKDGFATKTKDSEDITSSEDEDYYCHLLRDSNPYDMSEQSERLSHLSTWRWEQSFYRTPSDKAIEFYDDYFREEQ